MSLVDGAVGRTVTVPGGRVARWRRCVASEIASETSRPADPWRRPRPGSRRRGRRCPPGRGSSVERGRAADRGAVARPLVLVGQRVAVGVAEARWRGGQRPGRSSASVGRDRHGAGDRRRVRDRDASAPPRTAGLVPPMPSLALTSTSTRSPRSPLPAALRSSVRFVAPAIGDAVAYHWYGRSACRRRCRRSRDALAAHDVLGRRRATA